MNSTQQGRAPLTATARAAHPQPQHAQHTHCHSARSVMEVWALNWLRNPMYARYCSVQACCMRETTSRTCGGHPPERVRGAVQQRMWAGGRRGMPNRAAARLHRPATLARSRRRADGSTGCKPARAGRPCGSSCLRRCAAPPPPPAMGACAALVAGVREASLCTKVARRHIPG